MSAPANFCSSQSPASSKLNANPLRRTMPPIQGRTEIWCTLPSNFFLPFGTRYQKVDLDFVAANIAKSIGAFKPVISLNTMQIAARIEKTKFSEKLSVFDVWALPHFSHPRCYGWHFNSPRAYLKPPISDFPDLLRFVQN